jgi:hypothetical protein
MAPPLLFPLPRQPAALPPGVIRQAGRRLWAAGRAGGEGERAGSLTPTRWGYILSSRQVGTDLFNKLVTQDTSGEAPGTRR